MFADPGHAVPKNPRGRQSRKFSGLIASLHVTVPLSTFLATSQAASFSAGNGKRVEDLVTSPGDPKTYVLPTGRERPGLRRGSQSEIPQTAIGARSFTNPWQETKEGPALVVIDGTVDLACRSPLSGKDIHVNKPGWRTSHAWSCKCG